MMSRAERAVIVIGAIIAFADVLFLIAMYQAHAREDCYHQQRDERCPAPTWLERRVDDVLRHVGVRLMTHTESSATSANVNDGNG